MWCRTGNIAAECSEQWLAVSQLFWPEGHMMEEAIRTWRDEKQAVKISTQTRVPFFGLTYSLQKTAPTSDKAEHVESKICYFRKRQWKILVAFDQIHLWFTVKIKKRACRFWGRWGGDLPDRSLTCIKSGRRFHFVFGVCSTTIMKWPWSREATV